MKNFGAMLAMAFSLSVLPAMATVHAAQTVQGTVVTPDNTPVEGARVEIIDSKLFQLTDARGSFRFDEVETPAMLRILHPRFRTLEAECCAKDGTVFVLSPKQTTFGEIEVTANREGNTSIQPISVATSSIKANSRPAPASSVVDLAEGMPGVAETGQGGMFQAYSIRGTGGQRVLSLVAGTRILTERRAGATASFIDPLLLASVNVVRGPYSSYYGSGAVGGVMEAVPRRFDETVVDVGWESEGDANHIMAGFELEGWSIGLARRSSNATETPEGLYLPSQFEQYSATVGRTWSLDSGIEFDLVLVPTLGKDIGKPNQRYPGRITTYPDERHLVSRFVIRRPGVWHIDIYGHPNSLDSDNLKSDEHSLVENSAFDFGLNLQRELSLPRAFAGRVGFDYFGRRGVEAVETIDDLVTGSRERVTTLDGQQDEAAIYGSLRRSFAGITAELGGRFTWIDQANAGADDADDSAVTGFFGLSKPLGRGFELVANIGTGFRFPGLSERYYSGSTGRGEVVANAGLDPERSLTTDLGLRYFGNRLYMAGYVYRTEIDDYIERIDVEPGVRTYVNLTSGTITGVELETFFQINDEWRFEASGQLTDGEGDDDTPLAESPSDRLTLGGTYTTGPWSSSLRWQHRFDKNDPGPGEVATENADIVSASLRYQLPHELQLTLFVNNLLDETYLPSADDLAVPAARRSFGLSLRWGI